MIIATRASALAVWQASHVGDLLRGTGVESRLAPMTTDGDRRIAEPLDRIGGKGVFVSEVQQAVVDGRADIAVHSAKDLPSLTPDGLTIAAVPRRGSPLDVLVGGLLDELPAGAVVATGSRRRAVQLLDHRPDLRIVGLRGNIATRLARVGTVDPVVGEPIAAVVVAAAAIERLGLDELGLDGVPCQQLSVGQMVPQVGQGTLAVECRADDLATLTALARIDDADSHAVLKAERAFLAELGGDCTMPAGAYATIDNGVVAMTAVLAPTDGGPPVTESDRGRDGVELGVQLAVRLRRTVG